MPKAASGKASAGPKPPSHPPTARRRQQRSRSAQSPTERSRPSVTPSRTASPSLPSGESADYVRPRGRTPKREKSPSAHRRARRQRSKDRTLLAASAGEDTPRVNEAVSRAENRLNSHHGSKAKRKRSRTKSADEQMPKGKRTPPWQSNDGWGWDERGGWDGWNDRTSWPQNNRGRGSGQGKTKGSTIGKSKGRGTGASTRSPSRESNRSNNSQNTIQGQQGKLPQNYFEPTADDLAKIDPNEYIWCRARNCGWNKLKKDLRYARCGVRRCRRSLPVDELPEFIRRWIKKDNPADTVETPAGPPAGQSQPQGVKGVDFITNAEKLGVQLTDEQIQQAKSATAEGEKPTVDDSKSKAMEPMDLLGKATAASKTQREMLNDVDALANRIASMCKVYNTRLEELAKSREAILVLQKERDAKLAEARASMDEVEKLIEEDSKLRDEMRASERAAQQRFDDKVQEKIQEFQEKLGKSVSEQAIKIMAETEAKRIIQEEDEAAKLTEGADGAGDPASTDKTDSAKRKEFAQSEESNKRARAVLNDARKLFSQAVGSYTQADNLLKDELAPMDEES